MAVIAELRVKPGPGFFGLPALHAGGIRRDLETSIINVCEYNSIYFELISFAHDVVDLV